MGKFNKNQSGFSIVEVVAAIAVIVLIGILAYIAYKNHNKPKTTAVTTTKKVVTQAKTSKPPAYTSSDNIFSLTYPAGWISTGSANQCGEITCVGQVGYSLNSNTESPSINIIEVQSSLSPTDWFAQNEGPTADDITNTNSINGYSTYFNQRGSSPKSLVDYSYVLSHNGYIVDVSMRVIYVDTNAGIDNNFTQYVPQLTQTVDSIKFNN